MKSLKFLVVLLLASTKLLTAQMPLDFGSIGWKYFSNVVYTGPEDYNTGTSAGIVNWTSPLYNTFVPAGWDNSSSNILPLGYKVGSSSYATTVPFSATPQIPYGSDATQKPLVTYYRKSIVVNIPNGGHNLADYSSFNLKLKADDGAVVYFNGAEVYRVNLPSGVITNSTPVINPNINETNFWWPSSSTSHNIPNGSFPLHPTINTITITVEIHQGANSTTTLPAYTSSSSDSFFDIELTGVVGPLTPAITRGPYLQLPHPTGMQIRWRTNTALVGKVCYGTSSGSLTTCVNDLNTVPSNEHIVNLTGLLPNTTYYYAVQHTTGALVETSTDHKFATPPMVADNNKTTRIWVTGDASEGSYTGVQNAVIDGFQIFKNTNTLPPADLWLLLGDNAYDNGTDSEYGTKFFDKYDAAPSNVMKQTPILPCVGNHDYYLGGPIPGLSSASPIETLNQLPSGSFTVINPSGNANSNFRLNKNNPFYDIFSMPDITNPTIASKYSTSSNAAIGKKGFYSYNHNNIHFVCLDSYGFYSDYLIYGGINDFPAPSTNPQIQWLIADLAANTQKWTILYWHHAPYTRGGGHFSDNTTGDEFILKGIRERLIKYLDEANYKVDLVLNGHSHSYERSKLLKNHHGVEVTFVPSTHNDPSISSVGVSSNANSNGTFLSSTTCPYIKSTASTINEGIVYVVTGSAGQIQPTTTPTTGIGSIIGHSALNGATFSSSPHPGITSRGTIQEEKGGSFYIEIKGNRLDAKFIDETGAVGDQFSIFKDVNTATPITKLISPNELPIQTPDLQILPSPTWSGVSNFTISGPTIATATPFSGASVSVITPEVGPVYTIKDGTGCLSQTYNFLFDGFCWPDVTIKNTIDTPVYQQISSTSRITAKNLIRLGSNVMYRARYAINLNHNGVSGSPLFEIQQSPLMPTRFQSLIVPNILSTCPAVFVPPPPPTE